MTINTFLDEMEQLLGCDGYISILENTRKLKTDSNEYVKVKELYFKANEENEELKEQITCLESDSYNEVSLAEYEELKEKNEELEKEIEEFKKEIEELSVDSNELQWILLRALKKNENKDTVKQ